jgi:hypothetical protein
MAEMNKISTEVCRNLQENITGGSWQKQISGSRKEHFEVPFAPRCNIHTQEEEVSSYIFKKMGLIAPEIDSVKGRILCHFCIHLN